MSVGKRKHENLMSNNLTIVKFSPLRDAKLTIPLFTLRRRSERKANARQRSTRQWLQTTSFPGSLFFLPLQGREEERPWERGCRPWERGCDCIQLLSFMFLFFASTHCDKYGGAKAVPTHLKRFSPFSRGAKSTCLLLAYPPSFPGTSAGVRTQRPWGLFLESPETFRAYFG